MGKVLIFDFNCTIYIPIKSFKVTGVVLPDLKKKIVIYYETIINLSVSLIYLFDHGDSIPQ